MDASQSEQLLRTKSPSPQPSPNGRGRRWRSAPLAKVVQALRDWSRATEIGAAHKNPLANANQAAHTGHGVPGRPLAR